MAHTRWFSTRNSGIRGSRWTTPWKGWVEEAIEIKKHPFNFNREDGLKISNTWNLVLEKHKKENIKPRGSLKKTSYN
jgi:hypothetical protein